MGGEEEREPNSSTFEASYYYSSNTRYDQDLDFTNVRYSLESCFSHPCLLADAIAQGMAWNLSFEAAEPDSGAGPFCRGCETEERTFYRYFFRHLTSVIEHIERRRGFVDDFLATGGAIMFTLRLFGGGNIGDALAPETLMRMAKLGVRLRIEVVPVWPAG